MRTVALIPAASSSARRDLPMPGSPTIVTSTGLPVVLAKPRLWPRMACSLTRLTKGIVRRVERVVRPSTGQASIGSSKPFARTRLRRPKETLLMVSVCAVDPARTWPGSAAVCSRAAAFTTEPVTNSWPGPDARRRLSRFDADSNLQLFIQSGGRGEPTRPPADGEPGPNRAQRVVLMHLG